MLAGVSSVKKTHLEFTSPQAGGPGFNSRCRPRQTGGQLLQDPAVKGHNLGCCP